MKRSTPVNGKWFSFQAFAALFIVSVCAPLAMACATAFYGPEFDRHLVVEIVDESSLAFRVIVPAIIEDRSVESAWLAYYDKPFNGMDQPRGPVHYDEVALDRDGDKFIGEFDLSKLEPELYVTIRIHLGGWCGATAEKLVPLPQVED